MEFFDKELNFLERFLIFEFLFLEIFNGGEL